MAVSRRSTVVESEVRVSVPPAAAVALPAAERRLSQKETLVREGILTRELAFTGPFGMQLGIEGRCNYSCVFCPGYSPNRPEERRARAFDGHMPEAVFDRLVDSAARLGVEQISLVGMGEPLLHPGAPQFLTRIKAAGIRLMVTTNGSALTPAWCERFLGDGLDILNVSFSAGTQETYAAIHGRRHAARFDAIPETLRWLTTERRRTGRTAPRLVMRCTVIRDNIAEVADWVARAVDCGADELVLQTFVSTGFGPDLRPTPEQQAAGAALLRPCLARLERAGIASNLPFMISLWEGAVGQPTDFLGYPLGADFYHRYPCLAGWTYIVISEAGQVFPCCYCSHPLGNIFEQSLEEIWHGPAYRAFRRRLCTLPASAPGCRCLDGCGSVRENIRTIERLALRSALQAAP